MSQNFAAHLRTLDLPLKEFDAEQKTTYYFDIEYKGVTLCYIHLGKSFTIYSSQVPCSWIYWQDKENDTPYAQPIVDEEIRKRVWKKVRTCNSCGCGSEPGLKKRILGKDFDKVCVSALGFRRVTTTTDWECIKQMITAMKHDIDSKFCEEAKQ